MANFDPFIDIRRTNNPALSKSHLLSSRTISRTSVLTSVVPMFRKHADNTNKTPILSLKLSSASFLDTTVTDDVNTERPLYTIKTFGPTTTIKRADSWDGDTTVAEIRWSKTLPSKGKNDSDGVTIQLRGMSWKGSETFLKRGSSLSAGRKFKIPNYAQSLKWKRHGNEYWCTTPAVKGPIAALYPPDSLHTPQFHIFETLHDKNDARPMLAHHGVSTLLLDYLLVTALFVLTDIQAWTKFQGADLVIPIGDVPEFPGLPTPQSAPSTSNNFATSNRQWRKIMYGEPIYTNRPTSSSYSMTSSSEALTPTATVDDQRVEVQDPTPLVRQSHRYSNPEPSSSTYDDFDETAHIHNPEPASSSFVDFDEIVDIRNALPPPRRPSSPVPSSAYSEVPSVDSEKPSVDSEEPVDDVNDDMFFSPILAQVPSPASESIFSPISRGAAPSHTYLDPSFYHEGDASQTPTLPEHAHHSGLRASSSKSRPPSTHSSASSSSRRLPGIPNLAPIQPLIPRPRSTPPRPRTSPSMNSLQSASSSSDSRHTTVRDTTINPRRPSRQLPRPPQTPSVASIAESERPEPPSGRTRSHSTSHSAREREKQRRPRTAYSQRTLPSPPTSSARESVRATPLHLQRVLSEDGRLIAKEVDDDWVGAGAPGTTYDMPPPAYYSINFSPTLSQIDLSLPNSERPSLLTSKDSSEMSFGTESSQDRVFIVVMGVSGTGKSTLGSALASALGFPYVEGDSLHPDSNVAKMSSGIPLTDTDREPWLALIRSTAETMTLDGSGEEAPTQGVVISCSALKHYYRDILRGTRTVEGATPPRKPPTTYFVFINGDRHVLRERMEKRPGHFMKADMLDSQLKTLENPEGEKDVVVVSLQDSTEEQVAKAEAGLTALFGRDVRMGGSFA
ncbi:hypothetical protein H0H93_000399 [Arthromyces matolae]|nr:hypothetical protein H0H93_000399 [Arthromyces matolae]